MSRKRVAVLGSTGSVGVQALDVVARHPDRLEVASLAAGSNHELLAEQVRQWTPTVVSLATESAAQALRDLLGAQSISRRIVAGDNLRKGGVEGAVGQIMTRRRVYPLFQAGRVRLDSHNEGGRKDHPD